MHLNDFFFHKIQTTEEQGIDSYIGKTRVWTVIKVIFHMIEWPLKGPFLFLCITGDAYSYRVFDGPCSGTFACRCFDEVSLSCQGRRRSLLGI